MKYQIRNAKWEDLPEIEEIYAHARRFMAENGNPNQWKDRHPPRVRLEQDILEGTLYVITEEEKIHGVFFFSVGEDPTYGVIYDGAWHCGSPYGTIHRIAGDGSGGILAVAVEFAWKKIQHLRIDTHEDNKIMQRAVQKQGFRRCGVILTDDGSPRIAYDKIIEH